VCTRQQPPPPLGLPVAAAQSGRGAATAAWTAGCCGSKRKTRGVESWSLKTGTSDSSIGLWLLGGCGYFVLGSAGSWIQI